MSSPDYRVPLTYVENAADAVVREVVELILKAQNKWQRLVLEYSA